MKKQIFHLTLLIPIVIISISSCKKKENILFESGCKIKMITNNNSNESYLFTYDDQFRLLKIENNDLTFHYSYNNSKISILKTLSGAFTSKRILSINDAGLITNVRTEHDSIGSGWTNEYFSYNGNQIASSTTQYSLGHYTFRINYLWSPDSNLTTVIGPNGASSTLTYTDLPYQEGDYQNVSNLTREGYNIFKYSKNLIKTPSSNTNYEFDTDNKVIKINTGNTTLKIEYTCR